MRSKMVLHSLSFLLILAGFSYFVSNCSSPGRNTSRQNYDDRDRENIRRTSGTDEVIAARGGSRRRGGGRSRRRGRSSRSDSSSFDCSTCAGSSQVCNTNETACVQCTSDTHCSGAAGRPICRDNICIACEDDNDCAGNSVCNCGADNSVCKSNITRNTCVACSSKCDPGESCNSRGVCVERPSCTTDEDDENDCTTALPVCVHNSICVECTEEEDDFCTSQNPGKVCRESPDNVCVECVDDDDCSGKSGGRETCDTESNTCVVCVPGSGNNGRGEGCGNNQACKAGGACVECLNNDHCSGRNRECNTATNVCRTRTANCGGCHNPCDRDEYYSDFDEPIGAIDGWNAQARRRETDPCWGNLHKLMNGKDGNSPCSRTPSWLKDENNFCSNGYENIQINSSGGVIWHNGYFRGRTGYTGNRGHSGQWVNGTFKRGTIRDTLWKNGVFESGTFEESIWERGAWKSELVSTGDGQIESAGVFCGGIFESGVWEGGWFYNGRFKGGVWEGGSFSFGSWEAPDSSWQGGQCRRGGRTSRLAACPRGSPPARGEAYCRSNSRLRPDCSISGSFCYDN